MAKQEKKPKKEKIRYVDDGRSLNDLSGAPKAGRPLRGSSSSFSDIWHTYWNAVRMMFVPMLVTIGILCVMFFVAWVIFRFA